MYEPQRKHQKLEKFFSLRVKHVYVAWGQNQTFWYYRLIVLMKLDVKFFWKRCNPFLIRNVFNSSSYSIWRIKVQREEKTITFLFYFSRSLSFYSHICLVSLFALQLTLWTRRRGSSVCRLHIQTDNATLRSVFLTPGRTADTASPPHVTEPLQPITSRSPVCLYYSLELCNITSGF